MITAGEGAYWQPFITGHPQALPRSENLSKHRSSGASWGLESETRSACNAC